jgi:hypothetical protein
MDTLGHDPNALHEPLGFVDILALLTLAAAQGTSLVALVVFATTLI